MKSNKQLSEFTVNPRIRLSFLWTAIIALYIYADFFNLMTPNSIQHMMDLKTPLGATTPEILIGFSILLIIPALMIPACFWFNPLLTKWFNIVFGIVYGLISLLILITEFGSEWQKFFVLYQCVELIVFASIVYTAIKWPKE